MFERIGIYIIYHTGHIDNHLFYFMQNKALGWLNLDDFQFFKTTK